MYVWAILGYSEGGSDLQSIWTNEVDAVAERERLEEQTDERFTVESFPLQGYPLNGHE